MTLSAIRTRMQALADDTAPRRVALRVMYDGTDFVGWQRQKNGRSVQGEVERMLGRVCGDRDITVVAAGRTDAGVHADGQVAHADILTRFDDARLLHALQRMSPDDLAVAELVSVPNEFHARFRAVRRSYRYRIIFSPNPFLARYAWHLHFVPDGDVLNAAAASLLGRHDFTSLSKHNPDTPDTVCEIAEARWVPAEQGISFHIAADRFLYGMVRLIVGLQIDIARGKRGVDEIPELLAAGDRGLQSMSAPACGLSLVEVQYPTAIFPVHAASADPRREQE